MLRLKILCNTWPFGNSSSRIFHQHRTHVTMGSYDGAESCELVGTFLLHKIKEKHGNNFGLYRDDGLGITNATPRQVELIKKDLCTIFSEHGLKITIETNKKILNFLDVTLNLPNGAYIPYTKPNNISLYIHKKSNHPPQIIKNIPKSINNYGSPRFHMAKVHSTKQFHSIKKPLTTADTSTALNFHRQPHQNC